MIPTSSRTTMHCIGAAQGIGRWFLENVFRPAGYRIIIWDQAKQAANCEDICDLFVSTDSSEAMQRGFNELGKECGVTFSLPEKVLLELYPLLAPEIPYGTPTLDLSSKFLSADWLETHNQRRFDTHSLHPLFGHLETKAPGQTAVLRVDAPETPLHPIFAAPIRESGIHIVRMTRRGHAVAMQSVQALTHFCAFVAAETIRKLGHLPSDFETVATPPYKMIATLITRIINGSPSTYASVQETWEAKVMRNTFIEAALELNRDFSNHKAQTKIESLKATLKNEAQRWKNTNERLLSALQNEDARLHHLFRDEKIAVLHHRPEFIVGWIKTLTSDHVEVLDIGTLLPNGKTALATSPIVAQLYRRQKHSPGEPVSRLISRRDLQILEDHDADLWIRQNVQYIPHSFTIITAQRHNPHGVFRDIPEVQMAQFTGSFHDQANGRWKHSFSVLVDPRANHLAVRRTAQERADELWAA